MVVWWTGNRFASRETRRVSFPGHLELGNAVYESLRVRSIRKHI